MGSELGPQRIMPSNNFIGQHVLLIYDRLNGSRILGLHCNGLSQPFDSFGIHSLSSLGKHIPWSTMMENGTDAPSRIAANRRSVWEANIGYLLACPTGQRTLTDAIASGRSRRTDFWGRPGSIEKVRRIRTSKLRDQIAQERLDRRLGLEEWDAANAWQFEFSPCCAVNSDANLLQPALREQVNPVGKNN
jgi:hypothetical protein